MPPTEPPMKKLAVHTNGRRFLQGDAGELPSFTPVPHPAFLVTREHRRFAEFADTVRKHRHIGICWGPPGVGKTLSARHYAGADEWQQWERFLWTKSRDVDPIPARVIEARTAFYTPTVTASTREVEHALPAACQRISYALDYAEHNTVDPWEWTDSRASGRTELLIIDEADRFKAIGLEQVRDYYDRHHTGVVLIGMPGIEKRLARYPQLYSRIGFAHEYRPLTVDELTAVLTRRWHDDGLDTDSNEDGLTRDVAIAAVARITAGNFRLVDRLLAQITRIRDINHLDAITVEVVEAAREALLIGR